MQDASQDPAVIRRGEGVARCRHCGFSLVELLVVIGIIALLIAFLMPTLSGARQAAQRVSCLSKIHEQVVAAQIHAGDHRGYFPLVGILPGLEPQDLDDNDGAKYCYLSYPFAGYSRMIAPITVSLASEMSYHSLLVLSNDAIGAAETDDGGFIKNFLCPSQASSVSQLSQLPMLYYYCPPRGQGGYIVWYTEAMSYIYNEAALGWGDTDVYNRGKGRVNQIHQPSKTMFVADGLGGSVGDPRFPYANGAPMATVYNIATVPPVTLADALVGDGETSGCKAGDYECFDLIRHHGKINIGFCDGHVETRNINSSDLASVYLLAP